MRVIKRMLVVIRDLYKKLEYKAIDGYDDEVSFLSSKINDLSEIRFFNVDSDLKAYEYDLMVTFLYKGKEYYLVMYSSIAMHLKCTCSIGNDFNATNINDKIPNLLNSKLFFKISQNIYHAHKSCTLKQLPQ